MATLALGSFFRIAGFRAEERRADNFANKHADEQTLKGGIETFEGHKNIINTVWNVTGASKIMSKKVFENLVDLKHPTVDSRIAKMKKALKTRFGVEA